MEAGANIVNDVSGSPLDHTFAVKNSRTLVVSTGGVYDAQMLPTIAELAVPCVLMHLRGTPQTMQRPENLQYRDVRS